ncbi:hypothetical protein NYP20_13530 [Pseudomonas sp. N3-W]|uniref:SGNH/GDSL hydrolase family protein n=1 Tax=Pseudomonas fungipugnans TaxID=3024217 RepID=A0ABT6QHL9_9PSED|nr:MULTISPECIES: hypothetical protein [unclassified Pseudomonas]MDI2590374.1 hypothetical protein [Pseudomonas sp. 681]UWF51924.1 hypothetical protein NYP20_13530 [Pseudomonas sp. N3-W]
MKTPYSTTTPRFLLLGDSHAGVIGKAAKAREVPFGGGPLGAGRDFGVDFFSLAPDDVIFRDGEMERLYRQALEQLEVPRLGQVSVPLVSTIGLSLHYLATAPNWSCYQTPDGEFDNGFLEGPLFESIIDTLSRPALAFYEQALAMKLKVFAALPPQRVPDMSNARVFMAAQRLLIERLQGLGIELIDVREAANDDRGFQRAAYCEVDDPLHGNVAFGGLIVEELLSRGL